MRLNIKTIYSSLFLYVILSIIGLFYPPNTFAKILLEDNFTDIRSDWKEFSPWGSWNINNQGEYVGKVVLYGQPERQTYAISGEYNWTDYSYQVRVKGIEGMGKVILFRVNEHGDAYLLNLRTAYQTYPSAVILGKRTPVGSTEAVTLWKLHYPIFNNVWYQIKVDVLTKSPGSTQIKTYIDDQLIIDYLDESPIQNGKIGLEVWPGGYATPSIGLPTETLYDDVIIQSIDNFLDLPFHYEGRGEESPETFVNAFNSRFTSLFDHDKKKSSFVNFLGDSYLPSGCPRDKFACYDSHNGIDFYRAGPDENVYPAAEGEVVYVSKKTGHNNEKCIPSDNYGCVVILKHDNNLYTLYAHMDQVSVDQDENVSINVPIGKMGRTGNVTGPHLHFSVFRDFSLPSLLKTSPSKNDFKELLIASAVDQSTTLGNKPSSCTYTTKDGSVFSFIDPNGWLPREADPWSKPRSEGGCNIESENLWKYPITE